MSNRIIEAVLRLSAKLGSMRAFDQTAAKLAMVDRKAQAFNRSQGVMARSAALVSRRLMAGVAGIAVVRGVSNSVKEFAAAERRLNRIGINADASKDRMADMFRTVNDAAQDYAMTQDQVTTGLESLVASGRSLDEALSFLPSVAATAQAAGAEISDIAVTADAVATSFGIAGEKMQGAFDIMVTGGKLGKFELKDMAQYLPSLAPAMSALGYEGEKGLIKLVAALQTIRIRTGDASEAATNMQNILQKMYSDDTAKKFQKFGIDLRKELATAKAEGKDLLDTFIELSVKATKGDLSKLPQLFTDAQFLAGMRALIQGEEALAGMESSLQNVDGSTLADLGKVLQDTQSKIDRLGASWDKFKTSFGGAVADPLSSMFDGATKKLEWQSALDEGKKKRGMGYWDTIGMNQSELNRIAFDGGWRADDMARKAEAAKRGMSPEIGGGSGWNAGGSSIPIPAVRPTPESRMREQYAQYGFAQHTYRMAGTRLENAIDPGSSALKAFDPNEFETKLKNGGFEAAQTVKGGVSEGGDAAALAMGNAIRAAGLDVAAQIAAAARGITINVDGAPRTKGGYSDVRPMPSARADTGKSQAGRVGGPD